MSTTSTESGKPPAERRSTLTAVANEAAVSIATVSKVLNGRPGVSPETRERVTGVLRRNGYRKRGTERTYSPQIELVFGSLDGEWAIELVRGAVRVASEHHLTVAVSESGVRHGVAPGWAKAVSKRQPAGVILVASDMPTSDKFELRARNVPFVIVDPAGDPAPDVPSIGSTNFAGGMAAARHLIELGHTRIGVIAGPDDLMATRARVAGFRSAMDAAGLPVDESLVMSREFTEEASPAAGHSLLSRPDRPTAIFATSDVKALGAYEAARALGIGIPDGLSIVGYDDLPIARWAGPPLTTVRQPLAEMAQEATKLVIRLRHEPPSTADRLELAISLVVRGSTQRLG
ncbi:MAG TPA: LacI family DNA-binding transcriptional regulator [Lacisediminihabitans sp.]|uniref:LacI family DNA-binding transcriptional regulator n=1 Tax=Lacisediminihabitans sp. TaxID=2787631 RepID=UPI002EDB3701